MTSIIKTIIHLLVILKLNWINGTAGSSSGNDNSPTYYNIGGVLSSNQSELHFSTTISVSDLYIANFMYIIIFFIIQF